jgi:hypothetical protein
MAPLLLRQTPVRCCSITPLAFHYEAHEEHEEHEGLKLLVYIVP